MPSERYENEAVEFAQEAAASIRSLCEQIESEGAGWCRPRASMLLQELASGSAKAGLGELARASASLGFAFGELGDARSASATLRELGELFASVDGPSWSAERDGNAQQTGASMDKRGSAGTGGCANSDSGDAVALTAEELSALVAPDGGSFGTVPLNLSSDRMEQIESLSIELAESSERLGALSSRFIEPSTRAEACEGLSALTQKLTMTAAQQFGFSSLEALIEVMGEIGTRGAAAPEQLIDDLLVRLRSIGRLLGEFSASLRCGMETKWPLKTFTERVERLLSGRGLHPALSAWHGGDPERVLELDGVVRGMAELPKESDLGRFDDSADASRGREAQLQREETEGDRGERAV